MVSEDTRAVSTVADVTLALLLVSAGMVYVAVNLDGQGQDTAGNTTPEFEPEASDELTQVVAASSITVNYSVANVRDHSSDWATDYSGTYDEEVFGRTTHGAVAGLLADAAVANAKYPFEGENRRLSLEGTDFQQSVSGSLKEILTSTGEEARVVAIWEPYNRSAIRGKISVGPAPPSGADVSTAKVTVPSGLPSVDRSEVVQGFKTSDNPYNGAARPIADSIVSGFLPPDEVQLSLERDGIERSLTLYRYERFESLISSYPEFSGFDYPTSVRDVISGTLGKPVTSQAGANAQRANEAIIKALAGDAGGDDDIQSGDTAYGDAGIIGRTLENQFPDADAETIATSVSVDEVTIIVMTW
jgi:hypothetical protein